MRTIVYYEYREFSFSEAYQLFLLLYDTNTIINKRLEFFRDFARSYIDCFIQIDGALFIQFIYINRKKNYGCGG
jgi:hypothetical protein